MNALKNASKEDLGFLKRRRLAVGGWRVDLRAATCFMPAHPIRSPPSLPRADCDEPLSQSVSPAADDLLAAKPGDEGVGAHHREHLAWLGVGGDGCVVGEDRVLVIMTAGCLCKACVKGKKVWWVKRSGREA